MRKRSNDIASYSFIASSMLLSLSLIFASVSDDSYSFGVPTVTFGEGEDAVTVECKDVTTAEDEAAGYKSYSCPSSLEIELSAKQ